MASSVYVPLLAALSLLLTDAEAFCDHFSVNVGFLFNCQLGWGDFFPLESIPSGVEVQYGASLDTAAGLPKWLQLLQSQEPGSPAFLYGTPEPEHLGTITLNAYLTRLDTLEKREREMMLVVQLPQGKILRRLEFYVLNHTMEQFLSSGVIMRFQQTLVDVYQQETAVVTRVINPSDRGILVPPPPAKRGVIVEATPGLNVTVTTSGKPSSVQMNCDPSQNFSPPPLNFGLFARDGFDINWCQYKTYTVSSNNQGQLRSIPGEFKPGPVQLQPSPDHSKISLIIIMAVGFVMIIITISGLAVVFFGRRKSRHQQDIMKQHIGEDTKGPSTAQKRLRDLARSQPANLRNGEIQSQPVVVNGVEGGLLEYHDVTDNGNSHEVGSAIKEEQTPPPPEYVYDEELLHKPFYESDKHSRLIIIRPIQSTLL